MNTKSNQSSEKTWTRRDVLRAISSGSREEKLARLRRAGIIDEQCRLTEDYISPRLAEPEQVDEDKAS